eukprot:Trichotokara_eunicae@DN98_c0_g1_i2.p1
MMSKYTPLKHLPKGKQRTIYPEVLKFKDDDPLTLKGGLTARLASELIRVPEKVIDLAWRITPDKVGSVLFYHNKKDTLCEVMGALDFYKSMSSLDNKKLII